MWNSGVFREGGAIVRPLAFGVTVNFWIIFALFLLLCFAIEP